MLVLRERFNDVWGRTSTDEKIVKHFICNYLFQVKRVDENQRRTDNIMTKIKGTKGQTTIYKTYKLKIK
jgi:hypothetical protein